MNIQKLTGLCFVGTGVLTVIGFLAHPHNYTPEVQFIWLFGHGLIFLGLILNLIGLCWFFSMEHKHLGKLGLVGMAAIGIALSHYIGKLYWSGLLYPLVFQAHPEFIAEIGLGPGSEPKAFVIKAVYFSGALLFAIGYAALGIALLRAKRFPPIPVALLMAGAIAVGIWPLLPGLLQMLSPVVSAVYAVGVVWLGVVLIRRR
ncbi:hypothetical protein N9K16_05715 [Alphaproteobacteria bacterium]|nr:hypothetical protein [Alphaproteobacteria bacterium]